MKKPMRSIVIMLIAVMTLSLFTMFPSAAGTTITQVNIKKTSVSLTTGKSTGLAYSFHYVGTKPTAKSFTWKSSNSKVATVSGGTIKAKNVGTATITLSANGHKDTCKVTVKKPAAGKFINTDSAYTSLNSYRKNAKVKKLVRDKTLEDIAKIRAKEIVKKFDHTRPNGKSALTLIKGNKYKGENIAKGQKTVAAVTKAWYKSKGHRENMLRKSFKKVGIACYEYNGVKYWVQIFSS